MLWPSVAWNFHFLFFHLNELAETRGSPSGTSGPTTVIIMKQLIASVACVWASRNLGLWLTLVNWKVGRNQKDCLVWVDQKRLTSKSLNLNLCPKWLIISATPVVLETSLLLHTPAGRGMRAKLKHSRVLIRLTLKLSYVQILNYILSSVDCRSLLRVGSDTSAPPTPPPTLFAVSL